MTFIDWIKGFVNKIFHAGNTLKKVQMATVDEDIFICPICMDIFENPKMLPCQHSFCKNCLVSFIQKKRECVIGKLQSFYCPLCRHEVMLENKNDDEDSFPTNYLLSTLLEYRRGDIYIPFNVTKHMSEKQTQTVNKKEGKRTRTIGTQIKRCKTTNKGIQANRNGTSVQNKRIQTLEARLNDTINMETQTIEAINSDEENIFINQNMINQSTTENNTFNCSGQTLNETSDLTEIQMTRQTCSNIVTYPESAVIKQPGYYLHFVIALAFLLLSVFASRQTDFDTTDIHSKMEELIEKIKQLYLSHISKENSASSGRSRNVNDSTSETESAFLFLLCVLMCYGLLLYVAVLTIQKLPYRPAVSERRWLRQQKRRQRRSKHISV
ncbi:breast cancer type 1 susceptibility protein homolog [Mercenaria mercenaria]|uniref:breast cancer type 1 susceptibility protein homolog n=1 Tax=Mercenaria mercenaria TaxID=6596 RepID=UPI00234E8EB4|nr:breast cancer type 1 susceptibility protein homolog [Mercenaria mercenaria]